MTDLQGFVDDLRQRAEDEAYWSTLKGVFGPTTFAVLRPVLQNLGPSDPGGEKAQVAEALARLLGGQAAAIEAMARAKVPVGQAQPWAPVREAMGPASHAFLFCSPSEEFGETVRALEVGLAAGSRVMALWYRDRLPELEGALRTRGHTEALAMGDLSLHPLEAFRDTMIAEGNVERSTSKARAMLDDALDAGYPSVLVTSSTAGSLLALGHHRLNRDWEAFWHRAVHELPLAVFCPYPTLDPPAPALQWLVEIHNWLAFGGRAFRMDLASA